MGNPQSKLPPEQLSDLARHTHFDRKEIQQWYKAFLKDCPSTGLDRAGFIRMYQKACPSGDTSEFANYLFNVFDENKDDTVDFRDFICTLSINSRGTLEERLKQMFQLYDIDGNGVIERGELLQVVRSIFKAFGSTHGLSLDEGGPEDRVNKIFNYMDRDKDAKITFDEFIEGGKQNHEVLRVLSSSNFLSFARGGRDRGVNQLIPGSVKDLSQTFPETSADQAELWEVDLAAFLYACKIGTKVKVEEKEAQEFVDKLDAVLDKEDLNEKRKQYLKDLRKLCCMFGILPSSFMLTPIFDEHGATPFATGGFSEVYGATLEGRCVAVKALKIANAETIECVRKLLIKEVVGWKWLRHENVLPFIGVSLKPPLFSIISERMGNGSIMNFVKAHPNFNRLHLLVGAAAGLKYLHEHCIVHGDLKGANILIDSKCCARLADFGLAVVIDESTTGGVADSRGVRGTVRWMAPELLLPERFGFTGEFLKQLPSISTDIYAIGMTILEVLTGCRPFNDSLSPYTVMYKVIEGHRPDRPPSGFSDILWELLAATWVAEDGPESDRRPSASIVLDQLKKDVDHWGKLIVPLVPRHWREEVTICEGANTRTEVDVSVVSPPAHSA